MLSSVFHLKTRLCQSVYVFINLYQLVSNILLFGFCLRVWRSKDTHSVPINRAFSNSSSNLKNLKTPDGKYFEKDDLARVPKYLVIAVILNSSENIWCGFKWTQSLISKTIAVHVRWKSLYNSLSSSAKQEREMAKFCVFRRTQTTRASNNSSCFFFVVSQINFMWWSWTSH